MGIYLANKQFDPIVSVFKTELNDSDSISSWDGLLYYISNNPLIFMANNNSILDNQGFADLVLAIRQTDWFEAQEDLIKRLRQLRTIDKCELFKNIGDDYFIKAQYDKSLDFYIKYIESSKAPRENKPKHLDQVYWHIGIILITIGQIQEGLKLIEYAYDLFFDINIKLDLIKYKMEFKQVEDLSLVEDTIKYILSQPTSDDYLAFLVWYYNYIGDYESSITSYLQIGNIDLRFKLVDYYMLYMLESNQYKAMESFLKPLREQDEFKYLIELTNVYIRLDEYSEALNILQNISYTKEVSSYIDIQKSICYLGLKRVIESISAINKIEESLLSESERESYYVQLAKLSKYSKDLSNEYSYNNQLLVFWQQKYRKIYAKVLHNTKWKVYE